MLISVHLGQAVRVIPAILVLAIEAHELVVDFGLGFLQGVVGASLLEGYVSVLELTEKRASLIRKFEYGVNRAVDSDLGVSLGSRSTTHWDRDVFQAGGCIALNLWSS